MKVTEVTLGVRRKVKVMMAAVVRRSMVMMTETLIGIGVWKRIMVMIVVVLVMMMAVAVALPVVPG